MSAPAKLLSPTINNADLTIESQMNSSIKMYFVVNKSLKMGKGKIAGQVGHGAAALTRRLERKVNINFEQALVYQTWTITGETKIVLTADESVLDELRSKYPTITHAVHDAGHTQIPANSFTVLAFLPLTHDQLPAELCDKNIVKLLG